MFKFKVTTRSKVKSRSHYDVADLQHLSNDPTVAVNTSFLPSTTLVSPLSFSTHPSLVLCISLYLLFSVLLLCILVIWYSVFSLYLLTLDDRRGLL